MLNRAVLRCSIASNYCQETHSDRLRDELANVVFDTEASNTEHSQVQEVEHLELIKDLP